MNFTSPKTTKWLILLWILFSWAPLILAQAGVAPVANVTSPGFRFDPSISLGTVLHLVGMLCGGIALYYRIINRIEVMETKLDPVINDWQERMRHAMEQSRNNLGG